MHDFCRILLSQYLSDGPRESHMWSDLRGRNLWVLPNLTMADWKRAGDCNISCHGFKISFTRFSILDGPFPGTREVYRMVGTAPKAMMGW